MPVFHAVHSIGVWILSYASQMQLLSKQQKKWAYTMLFIQTASGHWHWILGYGNVRRDVMNKSFSFLIGGIGFVTIVFIALGFVFERKTMKSKKG